MPEVATVHAMRLTPNPKLLSPLHRGLLLLICCLTLAACGGTAIAEPTLPPDSVALQGEQVYQRHCSICHALTPETVIVGPSLAGVATRAKTRDPNLSAEAYLQLSILRPEASMVSGFSDAMPQDFGKKLTGEELDSLVAFLLTLE